MKKLIVKELREQLPLAVIGLVVFSVLLLMAFNSSRELALQIAVSGAYGSGEGIQPLLANSTLLGAAFFCAIFGAALGFRQATAERHPDLWAFLLHRPIEPMTILQSKVVSGLLLYLAGAGLPLLGLFLAASTPGRVAAPFQWAMVLPLVAIGLAGLVFYGGGLLTGLRKARWYASRACGLGPPILAIVAVTNFSEFWKALLFIAATAAIVALAVWGSFRSGGFYRNQPALGKLGLALSAMASAMLVIGLIVAVGVSLWWAPLLYQYSHYQLTTNGDVVRISHAASSEVEITDLSGKPLLDPVTGRNDDMRSIQKRFASGISTTVSIPETSASDSSRPGYAKTQRFFWAWRVVDKTLWYMNNDGRLMAFHGVTRQPFGELRPPRSSNESRAGSGFSMPHNNFYGTFQPFEATEVLASTQSAFLVDLSTRELSPLFRAEPGDPILGYAEMARQTNPSGSNQVLIVTRRFIRLLDFAGGIRFKLPYSPSLPEYPVIWVLPLNSPGTYAVRFDPDYRLNAKSGGRLLTHVTWLNANGSVRQAIDLPKLPEPTRDRFVESCFLTIVPPIFSVYLGSQEPNAALREATLMQIVAALIFAGLGFWQCRRHRFSLGATLGWTIFHLLFGLAAFLAFLAVQEWPSREPCPSCRRLRAVNRERCEYCDAPFPSPPRTGVEIFEPLATR